MPTDDFLLDRLAIRDLVETYAAGIDRRDLAQVAALFAPSGELHVHLKPGEAPTIRRGPVEIEEALESVRRHDATYHLIGNHLAVVDGESGRGHTYCVAHHLTGSTDDVWGIRYDETYTRIGGEWRFAERHLHRIWRRSEQH